MDTSNYERERQIAIEAVRTAAQCCHAVQAELAPDVLEKEDRTPVTVADFGSQALVCQLLKEAFPEDAIIAEEDADALRQPENEALLNQVVTRVQAHHPEADAETVCQWIDAGGTSSYQRRFWTLDPIDGTKGFLRGDQYAIALALIVGGEVQVAALACPNLPARLEHPDQAVPNGDGCVYAAVRDGGAAWWPLQGEDASEPARVSTLEEPGQARFCESVESSHSSHGDAAATAERLGITSDPVRVDSQAKYAIVARGEADIYLRLPTRADYVEKIWDHAAGMLIVREAGGTVTDARGKPLAFHHGASLEENKGIVATNGHLHDAVIETLNAVGVS